MRIIQLVQRPQARGAEIFASWLSEELKNLGHQVLVITLFEGDFELPFSGELIHLRRRKKNRFWDFPSWRRLNKIIRGFKPDIIQANGADTLKFVVFSKRIFKGEYKLIFNNGGLVSSYISSWGHGIFNRVLFRATDALVSVSNQTKQDLDSFLGFYKQHKVIPVGIKTPFFDKLARPVPFPILVHIGGFTPEKNHLGLLKIFEAFHHNHPTSQLWLIGDGPNKALVRDELDKLTIRDQVKFLGVLEKPFNWIPSNSILVLPSISEGLPAVIIEAFYARIPVVANGVGGIPELIDDGINGFMAKAREEGQFVEALEKWIHMEMEDRIFLLDRAANLVQENYTIEKIAEHFLELYDELCESSN